jgi:hypothetical protein
VPVLFGRHNLPPLVEIGLTDWPKIGGAMAPPAPPGTTGLFRAATAGKTAKTEVLPGFCNIKRGGCSGVEPVMWLLLWWSWLPKICRGGPGIGKCYKAHIGMLHVQMACRLNS